MVVLHNAFRRRFALLPLMVHAVASGDTRAQLVADHLDIEMTALHDHHEGEDVILWPRLLATSAAPTDLIASMQEQHDHLDVLLATTATARERWLADPGEENRSALVNALTGLGPMLHEHLELEETRVLPLVERHLTVEDWDRLADESRRRLPSSPRTQIVLLGALLEDADPGQRAAIYAKMPPPARLLWKSIGRPQYNRYIRRLRKDIPSPAADWARRGSGDADVVPSRDPAAPNDLPPSTRPRAG